MIDPLTIKAWIDAAFDLAITEAGTTGHPLLVSMLQVAKSIFDSIVSPHITAAQAKVAKGA